MCHAVIPTFQLLCNVNLETNFLQQFLLHLSLSHHLSYHIPLFLPCVGIVINSYFINNIKIIYSIYEGLILTRDYFYTYVEKTRNV